MDFVEHSVFPRLQPAQPPAERRTLTARQTPGVGMAGPWGPVVQARRAAVISSLGAARVDLRLTRTSWEGKMRVCPREKPSGPVARNCRHRAILGKMPQFCLPPPPNRQVEGSFSSVHGRREWGGAAGVGGLDLSQPPCWEAR